MYQLEHEKKKAEKQGMGMPSHLASIVFSLYLSFVQLLKVKPFTAGRKPAVPKRSQPCLVKHDTCSSCVKRGVTSERRIFPQGASGDQLSSVAEWTLLLSPTEQLCCTKAKGSSLLPLTRSSELTGSKQKLAFSWKYLWNSYFIASEVGGDLYVFLNWLVSFLYWSCL